MQENWLITGGAGYIGSHIVRLLKEQNENSEIIVLDNLSTGSREFLPANTTLVDSDIREYSSLCAAFKSFQNQDASINVVHLAGKKVPPESETDPIKYWENNVLGSLMLAKATLEFPVKNFIFSSSCSVYGNITEKANEATAIAPISVYGKTKAIGEQIFKDYFKFSEINLGILRYFNVVGSSSRNIYDRSQTNLFPSIIRSIQSGSIFGIAGEFHPTFDGTCIRDYVHVADIADAHVKGVEWMNKHNENFTLNLGTGNGYSILQVVNAFKKHSPKNFSFEFVDPRPGDPASILANVDLIQNLLDWVPKKSLDEMVTSTLAILDDV